MSTPSGSSNLIALCSDSDTERLTGIHRNGGSRETVFVLRERDRQQRVREVREKQQQKDKKRLRRKNIYKRNTS